MILLFTSLALAMTPDQAVVAALAHDPALAAAQARVEAAQGAVAAAAGLRENPWVDARLGNDRLEVEASQLLSLTGEGLAAARSARATLDSVQAAHDRARLQTAAEARRAWLRAAVAQAQVEVATDELAGATRLRDAADLRLRAGDAAALEVRLARLEQVRAVGLVLEATGALADATASLAALTGDPTATAAGDPLAAAPALGQAGPRDDVRAADAALDAARLALSRERAASFPSVAVGVFYEQEGGNSSVGPTIGVAVPLWKRNPAGRASARGELAQAQADALSASARASAEQAASASRMDSVAALLLLLGDDPGDDAAAVLAGIEAAWLAGEIDLMEATLLRGRALEGRRAWVTARAQVAEAHIAAALATGGASLLP